MHKHPQDNNQRVRNSLFPPHLTAKVVLNSSAEDISHPRAPSVAAVQNEAGLREFGD